MNQEQSTAGITIQDMAHLGPVGRWLMLARYHLKCRGILKRLASGGSSDRPEEELSRVIRWAGFLLGPELKEALAASEGSERKGSYVLGPPQQVSDVISELTRELSQLLQQLEEALSKPPQGERDLASLTLLERDILGEVYGRHDLSSGNWTHPRIREFREVELGLIAREVAPFHTKGDLEGALAPSAKLFASGYLTVRVKELASSPWERVDLLLGSRLGGKEDVVSVPAIQTLDQVVLPEETKQDLRALCAEYKRRVRQGRPARLALFFEGPPGTGKSLTAEAIAAELGLGMYKFMIPQAKAETLKTLVDFISPRAASGRALMFFDEADSILSGNRFTGVSDSWAKAAFENFNGVAVFTSNRPIDPAIRRRMTYSVKFRNPGQQAREKLYEAEIAKACDEAGIERRPSREEIVGLAERFTIPAGYVPQALVLAVARSPEGSLELGAIERAFLRQQESLEEGADDQARNPRVGMAQVELNPDARAEVDRFVRFARKTLERKDAPPEAGMPAGATILLSGPPGTGKTLTAEAIASQLGVGFRRVSPSSLLSKWVGGTEENIRDLFAEASREGCVLMIDEAEGLMADRAGAQRSWELTQANELLAQFEAYKGVLVIATNNIERMDPAFARRLIFKVRLDRPDPATRLELWRFWQQRLGASDHTIERLASSFELTGGEIRNVAAKAIVREECTLEELSRSCEQELGVRTGREPRKVGI